MNIQLTVDDKRLGKFDSEGAVIPPAQAIDGRDYEMLKCSKFYFNSGDVRYFVVVPPLFVEPFEIEFAAAKAPEVVALPKGLKSVKVTDDSQQ